MTETALSDRDRSMLAIENQWWQYAGAKEQAIHEQLGISSTQYYQQLNTLIDREAALAYAPHLIKRLHRLRASRQRSRSAQALGIRL